MFIKKSEGYEYLIVGLGNPGEQYANSRHNAGFMAIDKLALEKDINVNKNKFSSLLGTGIISGHKCILLKPYTYMNNSGNAVLEVLNYFGLTNQQLIVIYDDIYFPIGQVKIKESGSSGGHKGMNDIIEKLNSEDFMRVRIGVGDKPNAKYDLKDWVVTNFSKNELNNLNIVIKNISNIVELIVNKNINKAMSLYNIKPLLENNV